MQDASNPDREFGKELHRKSPLRPYEELSGFSETFTVESTYLALEVLAKLGIGAMLGGAIGIERERSGRPAGVRTHMLLVIGVVLICEVSKHFGAPDNSRIAAQIVTGVGFLGAGTIMRTGVEVKGLTTAASLWAASAIGFAVSTGGAFLIVAAAATMLTLFTLAVVDNLESRIAPHGHLRELDVVTQDRQALQDLLTRLDERQVRIDGVKVTVDEPQCHATLGVFALKENVIRECLSIDGVVSAEFK